MTRRPLALLLLSLSLLLIALSIPLQVALRFEHNMLSVSELSSIWMKISILSKCIMALCVVNAFFAFSANSILFISAPLLALMVVWNNFLLASFDPSFSMQASMLVSLGFVTLMALIFEPKSRLALSSPESRWWRTAKRLQLSVPATINLGDVEFETETHDVSVSGTYLSKSGSSGKVPSHSLAHDDPVEVTLAMPDGRKVTIKGEVVRLSDGSQGSYPAGFGVKFEKCSWIRKLTLNLSFRIAAARSGKALKS